MSATFSKFSVLVQDLGRGYHNWSTDSLKVHLTNATPSPNNTAYGTPADLSTSGGYTAGGTAIINSWTREASVATLSGSDVSWGATGVIGPFRYAVLYNSSTTTKSLIGYWDYGAALSLNTGETFTVDFGTSVLTLA